MRQSITLWAQLPLPKQHELLGLKYLLCLPFFWIIHTDVFRDVFSRWDVKPLRLIVQLIKRKSIMWRFWCSFSIVKLDDAWNETIYWPSVKFWIHFSITVRTWSCILCSPVYWLVESAEMPMVCSTTHGKSYPFCFPFYNCFIKGDLVRNHLIFLFSSDFFMRKCFCDQMLSL